MTIPINGGTPPSSTDLMLMLVRLDVKMDSLVQQTVDHEVRLRTLEKARWPLPSVGALSGVAGVVVALYSLYH